jgi:hypothetical protein
MLVSASSTLPWERSARPRLLRLRAWSIGERRRQSGAQIDRLAVEALGGRVIVLAAGDRPAVIEQPGREERLAADRPDRRGRVGDPRRRVGGPAAQHAVEPHEPHGELGVQAIVAAGDRLVHRGREARGGRVVVAARLLDVGSQVQRLGEHDRAPALAGAGGQRQGA